MLSAKHRRLVRGAILALLAVGGAVFLWIVATVKPGEISFFPRCQLHSMTGLHCPGCGMTRALHSALNGQFEQAFAYNVLSIIVIPVLGIAVVRSLWSWAWNDSPSRVPPRRFLNWLPLSIGALMLLFAILRNIPAYPFTLLAPHELGKSP